MMSRLCMQFRTLSRLREVSSCAKAAVRTCSSYSDFSKRYSNRCGTKEKKKNSHYFGFGLALGVTLSYNFYKYFQCGERSEWLLPSVFSIAAFPVVKAVEDPGLGSGNGVGPQSPRKAFNFIADVAEKIAPSVVYIQINARNPVTGRLMAISNGSGFIIKSDGLILTNAHVVANKTQVVVKMHDGREIEGIVEARDVETDLATIRIKANNLPVLPLGNSSNLRPGEFVIAMGNPLTLSHTITAGVISSVHRPSKDLGLHQKTDYIQTDAAINVGNSGGPLVNLDCEAIGINTMKVTEGISFAIPSDKAVEFLKRAEIARHVKGPASGNQIKPKKYIGITMLTLTPCLIEEMEMKNPDFPKVHHGVLIWKVLIQSPAYESGLQPGDVITEINGIKIISASDVYKIIEKESILKVKVARGSSVLTFNVKPQESTT